MPRLPSVGNGDPAGGGVWRQSMNQPAADLHPLFAALRASLRTAFERDSGLTHTPKLCPTCGKDRPMEKWILGICDQCFRDGKEPLEEEMAQEEEAVDPDGGKINPHPRVNERREACPHCGKVLPPGPITIPPKDLFDAFPIPSDRRRFVV